MVLRTGNFLANIALIIATTAPFLKLYKKTIHSTNLGGENCQDYQTIGSKQSLLMWEYINLFDDMMC